VAYWITSAGQIDKVLIGFEKIRGSHTGAHMARMSNHVLSRYGNRHRNQRSTTTSASNNRTLTEALNNAWSLLLVEWYQLENHIPCMAHVVQHILGGFMSWIKVKWWDGHMPSAFKAGYMAKVMRLDTGFHNTVEQARCQRSHTLAPMIQMHTHKFIHINSYAQIHKHKGICTDSLS